MKILIHSPGDSSVGIPSESAVIEMDVHEKEPVREQLRECFSEIFDNVGVTVDFENEPRRS